jgi:hypothetical protein
VNAYLNLTKTYIFTKSIFVKFYTSMAIIFLTLISAGPVGNLASRAVPPENREKKFPNIYYLVQFILSPILVLMIWHPIISGLTLVILRLYQYFWDIYTPLWQPSDILFIPLFLFLADF